MGEVTSAAIHVRSRDRVALIDALGAVFGAEGLEPRPSARDDPEPPQGGVRLLVLPSSGPWTAVLPERPALAQRIASDLALAAKAPLVTLRLIDDAFAFAYEAYGPGGDLLDAYHSCPDAEKGYGEADASDEELERTRGQAEKLSALGVEGDLGELASVLKDARIERLADHDVGSSRFVDAEEPCRLFREQLGLSEQADEGFDALWELGLEMGDEDSLRYLVYAPPKGAKKGLGARIWDSLTTSDDEDESADLDEDEDEPLEDELDDAEDL